MKKIILSTFILFAVISPSISMGEDTAEGFEILNSKCVSCHTIKGNSAQSVDEMLARKAPDLIDSGLKFKSDWLTNWLVSPVKIRPAGYVYANHIKTNDGTGKGEDVVDESTLNKHMSLSKEEAYKVTKALITLKTNQSAMSKEIKTGGSSFMGEMYFDKLSGCLACHEIEPGYGGYSGPELYTAYKRLTPEYIYSFTKNPDLFNKKSIMPNKELSEKALMEVTNFILSLESEGN